MRISKEEFKKLFPNIAKELEGNNGIHLKVDKSRGYNPTVVDFIKRCEKDEEAIEIIDFLEKRGEITKEYAESLRKRIKEKGVRSFGKKREPGYYFRAFK
jgi:hypothetical protein